MRWNNVVGKMVMKRRYGNSGGSMLYVRSQDELANKKTSDANFSAAKKHSEQREFERYADGQVTSCYPIKSNPLKAQIVNASLGGLKLRTREMVRLNTDVGLVVFFRGKRANFVVKVLWEARKSYGYEYGVEFSRSYLMDNKAVIEYISSLVPQGQG